MIIVSGQLYILPERREAVLVAAREMSQRTRLESGCISYAFSEFLDESGGLRLFEDQPGVLTPRLLVVGRGFHVARCAQRPVFGEELRRIELQRLEVAEPGG